MEVLLVSGLLALGYFLNKDGRVNNQNIKRESLSVHRKPNSKEIYNSKIIQDSKKIEEQLSKKNWIDSENPVKTNIIPPNCCNINKNKKIIQNENNMKRSIVSDNSHYSKPGKKILKSENFTHNNMEPFFWR